MNNKFDKEKLYELLTTLPRNKVITYGGAAELLGNRAWARAVGNALHKNPDGEKYPCYKVVNRAGDLSTAYAFGGIGEQKTPIGVRWNYRRKQPRRLAPLRLQDRGNKA